MNGFVELCFGNFFGRSGGISEDDGVCWLIFWVIFVEDVCNEFLMLLDDDVFLCFDFFVVFKVDV